MADAQTAPATTGAAAPAPDSSVAEVVVTGLSRRQAAQTAPVSTTVFTETAIREARITSTIDLVNNTPGLSFTQSQGAGVNMLTVRGISQVQSGQSPVAVVVDGVQQMDQRQFVADYFNLSQIEVLRGPQGDLWGRNAIGGAIIINTQQPTNDRHVGASVTIGNGAAYRGQASLSGPIIEDRLFYDLNFNIDHFGGLLENSYLDKTVDRSDDWAFRGHIKANLTDNLTVDFRGSYDQLLGGANNFHYQPAIYDPDHPCFTTSPFGPFPGSANLVDRNFCANNRGKEKRSLADTSMRVVWTQPWATISNVIAWSKTSDYLDGDQFPYTASRNTLGVDGIQTQFVRQRSWEDEFRITSPSNRRFRWMVGAYYLSTSDYLSRSASIDEGLGIAAIFDRPEFGNPKNPTVSYSGNADETNDYALFMHLAYDITPSLTAEFGYRYDWNGVDSYVDPASTFGVLPGCLVLKSDACLRKASFNKAQPKVTLTWRASPNLTVFADYGVGFRSGGFNQSGTAVAAGVPGVYDMVSAESAKTAEIGFKSQWLDRRLTVNATAYDTVDRNPAYLLFVGAISAQVLVTIDKVHIDGFDADINYNVMPGLDVFANAGYTYSSIRNYTVNPLDKGNRAPLIPDFNGDIGVQYRHDLTDKLSGFARFDAQLFGAEFWDPENSTGRNPFNLYNLKLGVESPSKGWNLTFFVNNLLDKAYNANYVAGGFAIPAEPRTFGAELRVNY